MPQKFEKLILKENTYRKIIWVRPEILQDVVWDFSHAIKNFWNWLVQFKKQITLSYCFDDPRLLLYLLFTLSIYIWCVGILIYKLTKLIETYLDCVKLSTHTTISSIMGAYQNWLFFAFECLYFCIFIQVSEMLLVAGTFYHVKDLTFRCSHAGSSHVSLSEHATCRMTSCRASWWMETVATEISSVICAIMAWSH